MTHDPAEFDRLCQAVRDADRAVEAATERFESAIADQRATEAAQREAGRALNNYVKRIVDGDQPAVVSA